jgi:Fic family protein
MAYIETIKRGKQNFYYLTQTVRYQDKYKKIRWFLAKGNVKKEELEKKAKKVEKELQKKVAQYQKTPSLYILDKKTQKELENIKLGYKKIIKKLSKVEYEVIEKQHLISFTFNTNALEGSTISLKDTVHIMEDGIVPANHELREIHEITNTKKAYEFMKNYKGLVSSPFIKKIHYNLTFNILNEQAGNYRRIQVYMGGSKHKPPKAKEVKSQMSKLMGWIKNNNNLHPVILLAYIHHYFIAIHPFIDGNGRTGRLLLNFMLMKAGYPPICIRLKERIKYIDNLEKARNGNPKYFIEFIISKVKEAYKDLVDNTK